MTGRKVLDTGRRGKLFYLVLDQAPFPVFHLKMTGSVRVLPFGQIIESILIGKMKGQEGLKYKDFSTEDTNWPPRFTRFVFVMDDGSEMAFTDIRRFARVRLVSDPLNEPPISDLGPDPVLNMPKVAVFRQMVQLKKVTIKKLLLDQTFIAGIGNWMADEVHSPTELDE